MVTAGNGIKIVEDGLSVNSNLNGFLRQSITISRSDEQQKYTENETAKIQNILRKWIKSVKTSWRNEKNHIEGNALLEST